MGKGTAAEPPRREGEAGNAPKLYTLIGPDGRPYRSPTPGRLGGHRRQKGYGRLGCPAALRWIAKGYYVKHRVFFADEATAVAAGYRPCAVCMPEQYRAWKEAGRSRKGTGRQSRVGDL